MLQIKDDYNNGDLFDFRLNKVEYNQGWVYTLTSEKISYPLIFKLPYLYDSVHPGNSVSVYLLKNNFFAQSHVIEIKVDECTRDNGRIGYITQLNSIFDSSILSVNKHLISYFYYAIGNIFFNDDFKQTKIPDISKGTFDISDFFDDDVLLLMVYDQAVNEIPNFNIQTYIPSLYKYGFYFITKNRRCVFENNTNIINSNYQYVTTTPNKAGYFSLRLLNIKPEIITETFLYEIFQNQLLKKNDQETRFLILFQVIEVLIAKILTVELKQKICTPNIPLEAVDLRKAISDELSTTGRINKLFINYTNIDHSLKEIIKQEIYEFLSILGFSLYTTQFDSLSVTLPTIFYDYRNKLVHNHRAFMSNILSDIFIEGKMNNINSLAELIIIDIITTYLLPSQ